MTDLDTDTNTKMATEVTEDTVGGMFQISVFSVTSVAVCLRILLHPLLRALALLRSLPGERARFMICAPLSNHHTSHGRSIALLGVLDR